MGRKMGDYGTDRRHCPLDSARRLGFDGAMWSLAKPGYDPETMRAIALAYRRERQAGQLDGPAREAAIARAIAMLRDGEIDRVIEERHRRRLEASARMAKSIEEDRDPRNWTAAKIRRTIAKKREAHEEATRRRLGEIARLETALAAK